VGKKVLLIEAGGPSLALFGGKDIVHPPPLTCAFGSTDPECLGKTWFEVPGFSTITWFSPKYFWQFPTSEGVRCAKVLGGGGVVNGFDFFRYIPSDFEGWPEGWQYNDFLPYYIALENVTDPELKSSPWRGKNGLLKVSRNMSIIQDYETVEPFLLSALNIGVPHNPDFNGESRFGVGLADVNIAGGYRSTSASAFLGPVWNNPNLTVKLLTQATRIMFSGTTSVGVQYYEQETQTYSVANLTDGGEVILTAGAVGSPHLLLSSGIGDPNQLQQFGIPVIAAVPAVGQNFNDHIHIPVQFSFVAGYSVFQDTLDSWRYWYNNINANPTYFGSSARKIFNIFLSSKGNISVPDLQIEYGLSPGLFGITLQKVNSKLHSLQINL